MSTPATPVNSQVSAPRGDGPRHVPDGRVAPQHLGPFDARARIAALEERIAMLEAKVFSSAQPK